MEPGTPKKEARAGSPVDIAAVTVGTTGEGAEEGAEERKEQGGGQEGQERPGTGSKLNFEDPPEEPSKASEEPSEAAPEVSASSERGCTEQKAPHGTVHGQRAGSGEGHSTYLDESGATLSTRSRALSILNTDTGTVRICVRVRVRERLSVCALRMAVSVVRLLCVLSVFVGVEQLDPSSKCTDQRFSFKAEMRSVIY